MAVGGITISNQTSTKSYLLTTASVNKPYLKINSTGYLPLIKETLTDNNLKLRIERANNTYVASELKRSFLTSEFTYSLSNAGEQYWTYSSSDENTYYNLYKFTQVYMGRRTLEAEISYNTTSIRTNGTEYRYGFDGGSGGFSFSSYYTTSSENYSTTFDGSSSGSQSSTVTQDLANITCSSSNSTTIESIYETTYGTSTSKYTQKTLTENNTNGFSVSYLETGNFTSLQTNNASTVSSGSVMSATNIYTYLV